MGTNSVVFKNIVFFIVGLLLSSLVHGDHFEGVPFKKPDPDAAKAMAEEVYSLLKIDEKSEEILDAVLRDQIGGLFTENTSTSHYLEEELHFTTARTIRNTYSENQFRADRLYTDKLLFLKGIVEKIGLGEKGQPVIEFRTGSTLSNTIAYLREEHEDTAIEFNRGETIDLLCVGGGLTGFYSNPTLYDCIPKADAIEYYFHEAKEAVFAQPSPKYPINLDVYAWFMTLLSKEIVLLGGYEACRDLGSSCKDFYANETVYTQLFSKAGQVLKYLILNDSEAFPKILDTSKNSTLRMADLSVCQFALTTAIFYFVRDAGYDVDKPFESEAFLEELYENNQEFKKVMDELKKSCPEGVKELSK